MSFRLVSEYQPCGDQPAAIRQLVEGTRSGDRHQVLLGITGSGKTFTVGCVINELQRPTLVIAHNKTLAAQLYGEFKELFPDNAVRYFVSYYDYYQPEAYVPTSDTYIEKDSTINDDIDRLRHAATFDLLGRRDIIIVASVSCIYGIGSVEIYQGMGLELCRGMGLDRDELLRRLVEMQYARNDVDFHRGTFRVRGDVVEVFPAHEAERALRVEFFGDEVDGLWEVDPLRGRVLTTKERAVVMPSTHYVTESSQRRRALESIRVELRERLKELRADMRLVEAQRLEERTLFDLEMLEQMGYCTGIENYSRHLSGREEGEPPPTLLDYFPEDFLLVIDESHQTIPQLRAMYLGDRRRKENLVEYGFRLPSALDNRPLTFEEFNKQLRQAIYVSATPGDYEIEQAGGIVVEQVIRPTGLLDPEIQVRPVAAQVDDLLGEIRQRVEREERVLVTTLTKRMAEDLAEYYQELGVRVRYMHSDIDTLERVEIIRDLRYGVFDVLIGINLLREGLDLPEVSLVAILDADKEGFLRSERSLIQTIGRAARHLHGTVIMYGDRVTSAMRAALEVTEQRRVAQADYNRIHGVTPRGVQRAIVDIYPTDVGERSVGTGREQADEIAKEETQLLAPEALAAKIGALRVEMRAAAAQLDFERAATLRDRIQLLSARELALRGPSGSNAGRSGSEGGGRPSGGRGGTRPAGKNRSRRGARRPGQRAGR